jgi:glycosyltransferase involved in cell wall biosynthesis
VTPRVSVCVPAYQAARWLPETLASVRSQSYDDFELVVVDDGSSDATPAILAADPDPRLRVFRHQRNQGQAVTVGESIALARGELIKLLDADDLLHPDCLARMVQALDTHPSAAFAFCRRDLLVEDVDDPVVRRWVERFRELHLRFGPLEPLNDGRELLRRYLDAAMPGNWVAEPAGVMARRSHLLAVGGYNVRVRQNNDIDLWLRLMARGDVAFVDVPLYSYRVAMTGVTGRSRASDHQWLDRLWTAEALMGMDGFPELRRLRRLRRRLLRAALHSVVAELVADPRRAAARAADLSGYARFRLVRRAGRAAPLYRPIVAGSSRQLRAGAALGSAAPAPAPCSDSVPDRAAGGRGRRPSSRSPDRERADVE